MGMSRRNFLAAAGLAGLAGCRTMGIDELPDVKVPFTGGPKGPLAFAVIGDLHILDAKSTGIVGRAVTSINAINANPEVHFTVVAGDLATDGTYQELSLAKTTLDRLARPYFAVPGNHDIDPTKTDPYANYRIHFGNGQWRHEEKGWTFIGLDTCNGTASDVTVPDDRLEWLAEQAKKAGNNPIALICHHPLNPNTKAYRVQNAEAVLEIFADRNLKLCASGHYHGNQEETRDGVLFTTTACCSSTRGNHDDTEAKGYRLFKLDDAGELVTEFIQVT